MPVCGDERAGDHAVAAVLSLLGAAGLVVGMLVLVAVAGHAVGELYRDPRRRPPDARVAGWHRWAGYGLTCLGVAAWAVLAAVVEPGTREIHADLLALAPEDRTHVGETERLAMLSREARWAAIVLAVGGLVLLARAHDRRRAVAMGVTGWVVADLTLDAADIDGWIVALIAGTVAGGLLLVLARPRPGAPPTATSGLFPLVYSGASITASFPMVMAVGPWTADQLSPWAVPLVTGLSVLLVAAGVANAAAASPTITARRSGRATTVALLGMGAAFGHAVWEFGGGDETPEGGAFLPGIGAVVGLVVVCALVCAGPLRSATDRLVWLAASAGLAAAAVVFVAVAWGALALLQVGAASSAWADGAVLSPFLAGPLYALPGIIAGALLGLLALLPVVWSHRPVPVRTPEPEDEPSTARPVALPGVPEILEWPPPPARTGSASALPPP
jgi:hypothetical protein